MIFKSFSSNVLYHWQFRLELALQ